jgi:hypothetical protein
MGSNLSRFYFDFDDDRRTACFEGLAFADVETVEADAYEQELQCLRDALAFAARTEHPLTITTISDILCRVESLEQVDDLMQQFAKRDDEKKNPFRG